MKTKNFSIIAIILCLCLLSCTSGPQGKKTPPAVAFAARTSDNQTVQRLITDYSGMKEDDIVSWAWIDSTFRLDDCGAVSLQPVLNYSTIAYPQGQKQIETALTSALAARKKNAEKGKSVVVTAAITGMQGKPGFLKRFSLSYEDTPSVELEIIIAEADSKRMLAKICHIARAEDIPHALDKLLHDVTTFLNKKL
jgi:hypothetical protein